MKVNMMSLVFVCCFIGYFPCANGESISRKSLGDGGIKIKINYPNSDGCSFSFSPVNFCDDRHTIIINKALAEKPPNFFKDYILISISERKKYHQRSIVVINSLNGEVYPVPIDTYSGRNSIEDGKINFNLESNKLCIEGDILVYRAIKSGCFCFILEGGKFTGYSTAYMK